jgi:hypothetical protein
LSVSSPDLSVDPAAEALLECGFLIAGDREGLLHHFATVIADRTSLRTTSYWIALSREFFQVLRIKRQEFVDGQIL